MLIQDLRYTFRTLRKTPLFTIAVVLTVTLGIGAATTIFTVVDAVMLRPLPFADPDRLMWVAEKNDKLNLPTFSASALNYLSWKAQTHALEQIGAIGGAGFVLSGQGDPEQLTGATVTASVLPILGVQPVRGRTFRDDEDQPGATRVVMIGEGLWKRRFGADDAVVGKTLVLNGAECLVIGVVPAGTAVLVPADILAPLAIDPGKERRLNHQVTVIGRLHAGVTEQQAQAEMDAIARRVSEQYPETKDWGIQLVTFYHFIVGDQLRTSLWVLFGAVACVLLIACGNVANLLLGRAVTREREMAVRSALGASRSRLLQQLLVESLVLSGLGGACGVLAALAGVRVINAGLPQGLLPVPEVRVSGEVLVFALAVTVLTGLLFGIAPAWAMARTPVQAVLKQSSRSSTSGARRWFKNGLAAAELALATMLLVGAGLLGKTLVELQRVHLGFKPDHVLTFQLSPPTRQYPLDGRAQLFYLELVQRLSASPGVVEAAISSGVPMGNGNYTRTPMSALGGAAVPVGTTIPIDWRIVSPGYFHLMGVPLLRGRAFTDADGAGSAPMVIASQSMARRFWGDADPIGRFIHRVGDGRDLMVVGVVGDVRNNSLSQETPAMYYPSGQRVWPQMDIVVRTQGDPASAVADMRAAVKAIDSNLPISTVRTMDEWVTANAAQPRLNAVLISIFSFVALVVAAVGVYGVLAYSVTQRTREIGVRMALGSSRFEILRLVVREGLLVGVLGIGAGIGGALALGRVLASLVYGVPVRDPWTFISVTAVLLVVALAACAVPARRAAGVDPLIALRCD
jgi:putative ABC transport system permease protein